MTIATRNAFFYGMTESIGETAITYSLTAARWGVLGYDFLTSDDAKVTYRWVGSMAVALGQLAFWSVVWAYAKTAEWAEAEVQSCIPTEPTEAPAADHIVDATEMVEADPFSPTVNPAYAAVAATIPTNAKQPTTAELRKRCIAYNSTLPAGDPRRIAGAARLTKAQALAALA